MVLIYSVPQGSVLGPLFVLGIIGDWQSAYGINWSYKCELSCEYARLRSYEVSTVMITKQYIVELLI